MKKNKITFLTIVVLMISVSGCGDFLDVNVDPNRPKTTTLEALLPTAIEATSNNHHLVAVTTGMFSQQLASYFVGGTDSYQETRMPTAWTGIYLNALTTVYELIKQAKQQESPYYEGIGKILQAMNLAIATDCWGDIPFTDAFQGEGDLTPAYDTQQNLYVMIDEMLAEAIALLAAPTSLFTPKSDDLAFSGNTARWIKTAYALRARYTLRLTNQNPVQRATDALVFLALAQSSNAEDLQITYNAVNRNPWFNNVASPIITGNFTVGPSEQIVNLMNGTYYTVIDPRMSKLFDNLGAPTYSGLVNGAGGGGNSRLSINTWYAASTAPILMVTFAEVKFMEAEARFLANGGTTTSIGATSAAYDAYLAGISAHMSKLTVNGAPYLADANVAVTPSGLTLELIMKEKFIALYLNPEAWCDVRRYNYSDVIYRGMTLPQNYNPALGGNFIQRVLYPLDEINRNAQEAEAFVKTMDAKMWWNQ